MRTVDLETAIADFLELGRQLQSAESVTGAIVLEKLSGLLRLSAAAQTNRWRSATNTALVRSVTPSFERMFDT